LLESCVAVLTDLMFSFLAPAVQVRVRVGKGPSSDPLALLLVYNMTVGGVP